jgi:hypothetical protein
MMKIYLDMEKQRWRMAVEVIQKAINADITELFIAGKGKQPTPSTERHCYTDRL